MNNATRIVALSILGIFLSASAWAATKYGNANIAKGKITVLREGGRLTYREGDDGVQINHLDVIRVGRNSNMVLSTVEKATVTLGSNAVFQVKPWQRKEEKGFFRMLFGRMRAKISGLGANERFNVHTATATIGVKGTEEIILTNVQGDATVGVTESVVSLRGRGGGQLNIVEGSASGSVGGRTPTKSFPITSDFQQLDSSDPTSDDAIRVPLGKLLVQNGIVSQAEVDASERGASEGVELPGEAESGQSNVPGEADTGQSNAQEVLDQAAESAQEAANESSTIIAPVTVDFEN